MIESLKNSIQSKTRTEQFGDQWPQDLEVEEKWDII
jgi:hypothetical protein